MSAAESSGPVTCAHIKDDGDRCGTYVSDEGDLCVFHDPARRAEAQAMRSKGARTTNRKRAGTDPLPGFEELEPPTTLAGVAEWQARVAVAMARGEITGSRGKDLTYALRAQREVLEKTELGGKADELLQAMKEAQRQRGAS